MKIKSLLLLCLIFFAGCSTTPLYQSREQVSIYLVGEPEVKKRSYSIRFKFDSPTNDPHLIQWITANEQWTGVEAFKVSLPYLSFTDTHSTSEAVLDYRRITIAPGKIEGEDSTFWGFSMLPSEWPSNFNKRHQASHEIIGRVVYRRAERQTVYLLNFHDGVLTWQVEGTDIIYEWRAEE